MMTSAINPEGTDVFAGVTNGQVDNNNMQDIDIGLQYKHSDAINTTISTSSLPPGSRSFGSSGQVTSVTGTSQGSAISLPSGLNMDLAGKMEHFKTWSVSAYKCTRQLIQEKLGKSERTIDTEIETRVENFRDAVNRFRSMLDVAKKMTTSMTHTLMVQNMLADQFSELGQRQKDLTEEFTANAETQRVIYRNGEHLLAALNFFTQSIETLVSKTMDDTYVSIKHMEQARLEADAFKHDANSAAEHANNSRADPLAQTKALEAKQKADSLSAKYASLRDVVDVKLKFLEENKNRVMHKQLLLFHNATNAFFTGNQSALESTLKQFSIRSKKPNAQPPSWLESRERGKSLDAGANTQANNFDEGASSRVSSRNSGGHTETHS